MGKCIVEHCKNRTENVSKQKSKVSFFRFPKDVQTKLKWIKSIGKEDWVPSKCSVICSSHFEERFFVFSKNGMRQLQKYAVPTQNLPHLICANKATQTCDLDSKEMEMLGNYDTSTELQAPIPPPFHFMHIPTPTSSPSPSQRSYSDLSDVSSTSSFNFSDSENCEDENMENSHTDSSALNLAENENYQEVYMNISDSDTPEVKRLKYEIRRLSFISKKKSKVINHLRYSKRRHRKRIEDFRKDLRTESGKVSK